MSAFIELDIFPLMLNHIFSVYFVFKNIFNKGKAKHFTALNVAPLSLSTLSPISSLHPAPFVLAGM